MRLSLAFAYLYMLSFRCSDNVIFSLSSVVDKDNYTLSSMPKLYHACKDTYIYKIYKKICTYLVEMSIERYVHIPYDVITK